MSYRVDPETGEIVVSTLARALAASREIRAARGGAAHRAGAGKREVSPKAAAAELPPPTLLAVLEGLQKRPRQYLELLQRSPGGLSDSQVWPDLKLAKRGHMSGVLTSLRNAFAKAGYTFEQVIERRKYSNGNGRDHFSLIRPEVLDQVKKGVPVSD